MSPGAAEACSAAASVNTSPLARLAPPPTNTSPDSTPSPRPARSACSSRAARVARSASSSWSSASPNTPTITSPETSSTLPPWRSITAPKRSSRACTTSGSSSSEATPAQSTLTSRRAGRATGAGGAARSAAARRRGARAGERRVLGEDRPLQLAQALARLDAELLDERVAGVLVGLQRVGLAVAAVEREHLLGPQALAVGVLGDQRVELADHLRVATEREPRLHQLLGDRDPQLLQPLALAVGERRVPEVRERRPAPLRERVLQRRRGLLRAAGVRAPARPSASPAASRSASSCPASTRSS